MMKDEKDALPFVLKTIAAEGETRLRGLDQLADILEIAYSLFQDKILIDEIGDPFVKLVEQKSLYENFNRTLIETVIAENRFYAKVDFNGTFITVQSKGVENSLKDLEVIWLVVNGIRKENVKGDTETIKVPREAKIRMLAQLSAVLQYFLSTSIRLIANVRTRQLEEKLGQTPEGKKREFLLRYKTELLKKDHGIKKVHNALIKIIDLELDLIRDLNQSVSPQVSTQLEDVEVSAALPVSIDKDFLYELSIFHFPFKEIIEKDTHLLTALKKQFAHLESKPKLHWYFNQFISDQEWEENCTRTHGLSRTGSKEIVAANFIPTSDTERRAEEIIREFDGMIVKNTVDPKYFGRFLSDTLMAKTLGAIDEKISELKKYVFHDANIDNYKPYAKASAKAILSELNKLDLPVLKQSILQELLALSIETDLGLAIQFFGEHKNDHGEITRRFKILKVLADEYFVEAMEDLNSTAITQGEPPLPKITMFDRIKRELDIVAAIYQSQYFRSEEGELWQGIPILDKNGRSGIDGQYIQSMDIFSSTELFNMQEFKSNITERYEATTNHALLLNQLREIRLKATATLDFYNERLIRGNQIVDDFLQDRGRPAKDWIHESEKYHGLVFISDYFVTSIAFGVEASDYKHSPGRSLAFRYIASNQFLAEVCQHILDFIDLFGLGEAEASKAKISVELLPENLFKDGSKSSLYLSALKNVEPPVVDQEGNYILGERKKGAVVVWMYKLSKLGKIDLNLSRQQRTDLVNRLVPGLNITLKSLFSSTSGSQQHYEDEFDKVLKEI